MNKRIDGQHGRGAGYRDADGGFLRGGHIVDSRLGHIDNLAASRVEPKARFGMIDLRQNRAGIIPGVGRDYARWLLQGADEDTVGELLIEV